MRAFFIAANFIAVNMVFSTFAIKIIEYQFWKIKHEKFM